MTQRIYANTATKKEIHRILKDARRVAETLNIKIVIDPQKARLFDFSKMRTNLTETAK